MTISAGPIEAPGALLGEDVRQGLQRLAQAHVVGEDAAHTQLAQGLHPAQALLLVVAQLGPQPGGRGDPALRQLGQASGEVAQALAAEPVQGR